MIPRRYPDWRASRRVIGSTLRSRPMENKASILEATRYLVWPQLASGTIQVPIHARLPLSRRPTPTRSCARAATSAR